jgi:hypothetical protein
MSVNRAETETSRSTQRRPVQCPKCSSYSAGMSVASDPTKRPCVAGCCLSILADSQQARASATGHPQCGGHLRSRWRDRRLRRGRVSGLSGPCLRKRQRRNYCASKNNSCSSHVFSFVELTFPAVSGRALPSDASLNPMGRTLDSDTEESALSGHAAPQASSTRPKIS